jgi:hypothetical protein
MQAFATDSGHEEHAAQERGSTVDDHRKDRRKSPRDLEREQCLSMQRVAKATGASVHELRQLMLRLADIDRCGKSTCIVAQGHIAADRMEADIQVLDLGDGNVAGQLANAARSIDCRLNESLDPAHDKKWYARWKFWSFLLGAVGPVASLTLQGLALRPTEPGDANADLMAKARKMLESWRRTSDPVFWSAVEGYVRQQAFSLETQAYLMHVIAAVFGGDTMKLSNAQSEKLAAILTDTYCDALGTSATMPSSDIYRRLSEGLEAADRETGLRRLLGRGEAAQIAMITLYTALGNGGSH